MGQGGPGDILQDTKNLECEMIFAYQDPRLQCYQEGKYGELILSGGGNKNIGNYILI